MTRRALILGCGGVAGAAWSIAALENLEANLGWDARQADIIVGTSAGAVVGALLSAGVSVNDLANSQAGHAKPNCSWNHDASTGTGLPPLPQPRFTGWRLALGGLTGKIPLMVAATGLMPRGGFDMAAFRALIDSVVPAGQWTTHANTWIVTVDTSTGERVAFGQSHLPQVALNDAVCASYGVPGWCPPVHINGRDYMDGGVVSPTSADLVADAPVDEVIILAPMASSQLNENPSVAQKLEHVLRRRMTSIVKKEVKRLEQAGKRVLLFQPGPEDLQAIGYNMMDPKRRPLVYKTALQTSKTFGMGMS